ncbi:TPA: type II toxin-antitoxin system RelE/ParE family toxin [Legionella pneumophila]
MRIFKTRWFNKAAHKAKIKDVDLCKAIKEVMEGKADDLGGGVYKKRLNQNRHRSIVLAKGENYWVYEFLFAKKDMDNISDQELENFRILAKAYADLKVTQLDQLLREKALVEICHEKNDSI